ncbi:MAG: carboxypeptidase-like regulatory domain-containing protein [Bacteroidota bacterium]
MKHPKVTVSIPEPCHENWQHMTPTEKGRFCKVCTKEVIDFTSKSDEEIIKYVQHQKNACGRFYPSQLNRQLIADRKKRNHWLSYVATLLLPMSLFSQETVSPQKKINTTIQHDSLNFKRLDINSALQRKAKLKVPNKTIIVTGNVIDDTSMLLPGASVIIKNTTTGKTTNFDGKFSIKVTLGDTLVISYVGFKSKEVTIEADRTEYAIALTEHEALEGLVVVGGIYSKNTFYPSTHIETEAMKTRKKQARNYFAFQRKKWLEKRAKRREKRAARKAARNAKQLNSKVQPNGNEQNTVLEIKGIIIDDTQMPLPAAAVQIKNTDTKVLTDFDGKFTLHAKSNDILQISYVGFTPKEIKITDTKKSYTIELTTKFYLDGIPLYAQEIKNSNGGCTPSVDGDKIIPRAIKGKSFFEKIQEVHIQKPKNPKKKH